ncbi:MATE family efflux transporter [Poseidonibacter lekithochrous]|uniref:MATE family efflux transporter n=1 Tax=Poseidonibacter lekithochrous TaxID=1904463 RepID=UPI0008FC9751|nr:MATE family efflux transporter [Poseidonibacter lekithochrous]QKJ23168.1 MATE family efflux protein [Poseidonibacter lekithochrous]
MTSTKLSYREYLTLAIPFVISTVTQPLLGAVDTAVLGRLDDSSFMGGVAIGAVIFNTLYWLLGFLRVSTSGFAAQSLGTLSDKDSLYAFLRPAIIAFILGLAFIVLQNPIKIGAESIFGIDSNVWESTIVYYDILIWGAPLVLISYVNLGWLMGRKLIKETLYLQVSMNVINIVLDIVFVLYFEMGVYGVAYATLFSQAFGFFVGVYLITRQISVNKIFHIYSDLFEKEVFSKIMGVNTDFLIRTICLLIMTNMFIAKGSSFGKEVLAANAVLFQLQYIIAYLYDGFANASSVYTGKAIGEKNLDAYKRIIKVSNISTIYLNIICVVIIAIFSNELILLFTNIKNVIDIAQDHSFWLILFPIVIGHGLTYAGLYNGATFTAPVRDSMILALIVFLVAYSFLIPIYGNHGLWLAFILFSLARTIMFFIYLKKMQRCLF